VQHDRYTSIIYLYMHYEGGFQVMGTFKTITTQL
ncbi:MAG: hypothetical protein ACI8RD_010710, partial [Bacillariaceae sp.]|jgi:hypothetical protein